MSGRPWTQEEEAKLRDLYGMASMRCLMKSLKRSSWAIRLRARRLGLRVMENGEGVTMAELARCLNISLATVRRWVARDGLPARSVQLTENQTIKKIRPEDFWAWAQERTERIDWTKIEPNVLPPEPGWVQALRLDGAGRGKYARRRTTTQDIERIRSLRRKGMTRRRIAETTGRSEGSVAYILRHYLAGE